MSGGMGGGVTASTIENISLALGDETTVLAAASTSVPLVTFSMPYGFTLSDVIVSAVAAPTGAALVTVDVHENGNYNIIYQSNSRCNRKNKCYCCNTACSDI
jgi:hypothetical protein